MEIPEPADLEHDIAAEARREGLLTIHDSAASYFQEQLNSPSGRYARRVLEQREITPETIKRLGLGYAPPQREALTNRLLAAGHQPDLILASGLAIQREGNKLILSLIHI